MSSPPEGDEDQATLEHAKIAIKNAGGAYSRFVLAAWYRPRTGRGQSKRIQSNNPRYGKSWASKNEIQESDKLEFLRWINTDLARGGQGKDRCRAAKMSTPASRTSSRVAQLMQVPIQIPITAGHAVAIEQGVVQCVKELVHKVVYGAHYWGDGRAVVVHHVLGKRRRKTETNTVRPPPKRLIAKRMTRPRLTQRRAHKYRYRSRILRLQAAAKAEEDLSWLQTHQQRLGTIIARQDLHELLPEGVFVEQKVLRATSLCFSIPLTLVCTLSQVTTQTPNYYG